LNVPAYMEGKVQWKPRGINIYDEKGNIRQPANTGMNFPAVDGVIDRIQKSIKERFHVDTFLMLANLEGRGQRTAYEVSELMAEKAAVLGAELGPLNSELDAILDDVYDIEVAAGRMPPPPDELLEMASQDKALRFDPVYMGPLAQAQRERFAKDGIRKFLTEIVPLVNVREEVLDNLNTDKVFLYLGDIDGVPQDLFNDPQEVAQTREARLKAQQEQSELQSLQQAADVVKTGSEIGKNAGGAMPDMMGAMSGQA